MDDLQRTGPSDQDHLIAALKELIDALDRRIPHVERLGEIQIAHEATALRNKALARIEELKHAASDQRMREAALADGIMSDDGGPVPLHSRQIPPNSSVLPS
jgi:hypothetical protein